VLSAFDEDELEEFGRPLAGAPVATIPAPVHTLPASADWEVDDDEPAILENDSAAGSETPVAPETQPASRTDGGLASPAPSAESLPTCPACGGVMWDNRAKKASGQFKANAPDFSCKDRQNCEGKLWPGQWPPKVHDQEELAV
jgi:hypothetical protein